MGETSRYEVPNFNDIVVSYGVLMILSLVMVYLVSLLKLVLCWFVAFFNPIIVMRFNLGSSE